MKRLNSAKTLNAVAILTFAMGAGATFWGKTLNPGFYQGYGPLVIGIGLLYLSTLLFACAILSANTPVRNSESDSVKRSDDVNSIRAIGSLGLMVAISMLFYAYQ